jgi:hypothetical protein
MRLIPNKLSELGFYDLQNCIFKLFFRRFEKKKLIIQLLDTKYLVLNNKSKIEHPKSKIK